MKAGNPAPDANEIDVTALLSDSQISEFGGEHSNEGVDYARFWAIYYLLTELEQRSSDYVLVFEFLQDIAVLDSAEHPSRLELFQLKKKSPSKWSVSSLCSKPPKPKTAAASPEQSPSSKLAASSVIGKLYISVQAARALLKTEGTFVTDGAFSLRLLGTSNFPVDTKAQISSLCIDNIKSINKKIASDITSTVDVRILHKLHLHHSKVTAASMREIARGVASEYLANTNPGCREVAEQMVETLLFKFAERSGPKANLTDTVRLCHEKGFSKQQFTDVMSHLVTRSTADTLIRQIAVSLVIEDPKRSVIFNKAAQEADRLRIMVIRNPALLDGPAVRHALDTARKNIGLPSFLTMFDMVEASLKTLPAHDLMSTPGTIPDIAFFSIFYVYNGQIYTWQLHWRDMVGCRGNWRDCA